MKKLDETFSFMAIVKVLATIRAKEANLRRRKCFYWQCFNEHDDPGAMPLSDASLYLPPRRDWSRPIRCQRRRTRCPMIEISRDAIYRKVEGVYRAGRLEDFDWGRRLVTFVEGVQARVAAGRFVFRAPELWLRPKTVPIGNKPKFRCISFYKDLSDRVVLSLANKHLSSLLDPTFHDCSYAFRSTKRLTHAIAVQKLVALRRSTDRRLYVTDCDMMKFFDTVNHDCVLAALRRKGAGLPIDGRIWPLVEAFLASFSMQYVVDWKSRQDSQAWKEFEVVDVTSLKDLYPGELPALDDLGLPQGGALSGLLANAVLDSVDEVACRAGVFYARYCDDMILVASTKKMCAAALAAVMDELAKLAVPAHRVIKAVCYGSEYYAAKSKGPYAWGNPKRYRGVTMPWVSYVGTSIKFDGSTRIRKETVCGHAAAIREECATFLECVRKFGFRSALAKDDAVVRLMYRLVAKGIGRINARPTRKAGRCWIGAFGAASGASNGLRQMRLLDRVRARAFARLLHDLGLRHVCGESGGDGSRVPLYFGKPFSYFGAAQLLGRAALARERKMALEPVVGACDEPAEYEVVDEPPDTSGWERSSMGR